MRLRITFLMALLLLIAGTTDFKAQLFKPKTPKWIQMMDDPHVNYYEAVETFEEYWSKRERPTEEAEFFNAEDKKEKRKKTDYAFEYKKFQKWRREMLPFVQEDGHILSPEERLDLWEKERQNRQ